MKPFFIDSEARSSVKILRGLDPYMTGMEPLIWTFGAESGAVDYWDVTKGVRMPGKLEDAILDERVTLVAHNVPFDRNVLKHGHSIEVPLSRWWCTMSQAYAHALPGSLEALGPILGLPSDMQKMHEGKNLIQLFCVPTKGKPWNTPQTHPVEWAQFLDYAVQDTTALREVFKRLPKHNYEGEHYRRLWRLDQEINERGFFIDQALCKAALLIRDRMKVHLDNEISELTSGRITAGTQRERVLHEMVGEMGILMLDMKKDTIKKLLAEGNLSDDARRLLELRRDSSLTSLTKYERALERVGEDGRMRHTLQFSGAGRTSRWAGRGVQPHNMPRPRREAPEIINEIIPAILDGTLPQKVDDVNQACQDALRGMIVAEPGNEFLVGDWSNIEGRVLAWIADSHWKLQAFKDNDAGEGPDLYVLLYAKSFNKGIDDVSGKERQMGKGMELSMGYAGGVGAFVNVAASYGLDLEELGRIVPGLVPVDIYTKAEKAWKRAFIRGEDQLLEPDVYIACDALKQVWRRQNPEIVSLWWDTERAVKWAIDRPGSVQHVARCKIWCTPGWLIIELPSGRRLLYAQPTVKHKVEYDEDTEELTKRAVICYMAASAKQWRHERTYSGKLVENIVQAIACDVLREAMLRADAEGYPLVLHVHDEMVAETPEGFFDLDPFLRLMELPIWWSEGLPLKAAGWSGTRYRKD